MTKTYAATLIEGDGIGPEVIGAAVQIVEAAGVPVQWERQVMGAPALQQSGSLLPRETVEAIKRSKVALKGPLTTPIGEGFASVNVQLRKVLDLYACIRPVKSIPGVKGLHDSVDLVVVRENTEDLYAGKEHEIVPGVVETLKIITRAASTRIAEFAFRYAVKEKRHKVTAVHKANIMKLSDGLFLQCCREVAEKFPAIAYDELIVDNACLQLVMNPSSLDVLLMENLYGDIMSDVGAGLIGGIGLVPGANIGQNCAVFEPAHGSWPSAAGKGIANPIAAILCAVMMLDYLGESEAAERVERALKAVLREGKCTPDLGGSLSTQQFTQEVIVALGHRQSMAPRASSSLN